MSKKQTSDMQHSEALRLDNQLCFLLYSCSRRVTALYRPLLSKIGLTYPQYLVMLVLWEHDDEHHPGISVSELGRKLHLDSGTLTPLLKRLESLGLLIRERKQKDERVVEISLTAVGKKMKVDAAEIPRQLYCHWEGLESPEGGDRDGPQKLLELRQELRWLLETLT